MKYFAGLDWGGTAHAICVVNQTGRIIMQSEVRHDAQGLESLRRQLNKIAPAGAIPIAIERPSGLIVDTLVADGYSVIPIHPNVVKACRPRYSVAGGKHDRGDAYLLADVLRTDGHRFCPLTPASDEVKALRCLVRTRHALIAERLALLNQLHALLGSFWPGATAMFYNLDSAIGLAFLERYPTPSSAARLGEKRFAAFLKAQGYSGRYGAAELLARLRSAPLGCVGKLEEQTKGGVVLAIARILGPLREEISNLADHIESQVEKLEDGLLIMSLPFAGRLTAAQILAEIGDARERLATVDQLAAEAGVVPVTKQSGRSRTIAFRWACNHHLRSAVTWWADNSRRGSPWAAKIYADARARGCRHPHAIRILARAWIRVLWKVWTTRVPYDIQKHTAAYALVGSA
jgi:transposase